MKKPGISITPVTPPCMPDCPDRAVGCHGTCERYRAFRGQVDEINARRLREEKIRWALSAKARGRVRRGKE